MSKQDLIIFGRSPFINEVDVESLLPNYTTIGFNQFGSHFAVDHIFQHDRWYPGSDKRTLVHLPNYAYCGERADRYVPRSTLKPFIKKQYQDTHLVLGMQYFTVSVAANWALLNGFKDRNIYLIGIDHKVDGSFERHDGSVHKGNLSADAHVRIKNFIYQCARYANFYQCNPNVANEWNLPYYDVRKLKSTS